jgi:prepilin-type N-terminal cleavage/methylation domain-containing protein
MKPSSMQRGFTLVELLVVIALLAIISAVAMPLYSRYIDTARQGALINNIATMEVFQEDFRLRTSCYAVGLADVAAINAAIGWQPQTVDGTTYSIATGGVCAAAPTNPNRGSSYRVTATDTAGTTVCRQFPQKIACP